jgi:hypothetical protein
LGLANVFGRNLFKQSIGPIVLALIIVFFGQIVFSLNIRAFKHFLILTARAQKDDKQKKREYSPHFKKHLAKLGIINEYQKHF